MFGALLNVMWHILVILKQLTALPVTQNQHDNHQYIRALCAKGWGANLMGRQLREVLKT